MQEELNCPISDLKGIGEHKEKLFHKINIRTISDLIHYFPRDYQEFSEPVDVCDLHEGELQAISVRICDNFFQKKLRGRIMVTVSAEDDTGKVGLLFFNLSYLRQVLKPGSEHVFRGVVRIKGTHFVLIQPQMFKPSEYRENRLRLQPVYTVTSGLSSRTISKAVGQAFADYPHEEECFFYDFMRQYQLITHEQAMEIIHFPKDFDSLLQARKRLAFEELYHFFINLKESKKNNFKKVSEYSLIETAECTRLIEALPYTLTAAQERVWNEISIDLQSGYVMNRLVQGDVGSGKTILAILAMLMCITNGYQAAFMAPTEVLAVQHYQLLKRLQNTYRLPLNTVLLTGKMTAKEKREAYSEITKGTATAIVGTHALFQEQVNYKNLSLVITDEQHRFGVKQRDALSSKGMEPHVLIMSATPIPRTLATVLYADLNVSIVDELPSKRLPIKSCVVDTSYRQTAYSFILKEINAGHQAYVICSQVYDDEESTLENVIDYAEKLRSEFPDSIRIEVLHGQMKSADKTRIMNYYAQKEIDILVSTTVIEVGIDVPNATVIMVENAERFGLAQLHQLRGRVGRGEAQSYCILVSSNKNEQSLQRLNILLKSNDGFYIANEDLRLRGPGDLFGIRQSGAMSFQIADIYRDSELVIQAAAAANDT